MNDPLPLEPPTRFGVTRLYRDAGSMAVASVGNAVLGVIFWAAAARMFEPHDLGVMTAVLAVIVSTGTVVATGIGDAYTALLPAVGPDRSHFYRRGQRLFMALALVSAMCVAVGTIYWLSEVRGSIAVAALVVLGVLVAATVALQNSTLVALGRARLLPLANGALSLGKLALLPLFALSLSWHPVELSVVAASFVVAIVVRPLIMRIVDSGEDLPPSKIPDGLSVRHFYGFVGQTTVSAALGVGLFIATPFLVTVWSNPAQGALFALSLAVVQSLDLIGAALTMSLVVHASSSPDDASSMARAILIRAVIVSVVGAGLLIALVPLAFRYINAQYVTMGVTGVIATLAVGTIIRLVYQVWQGLQRARRKMLAPLTMNVIAAVVLLSLMPAFCSDGGAQGGAEALLLAQLAMAAGIGVHYAYGRYARKRGKAMSQQGGGAC